MDASPSRVARSADDGLFELVIWSPSSTWNAGEAIDLTVDLAYIGPQATIEVLGSGSGLVTFGLEQLDGGLDVNGSWNMACVPYALAPDELISSGYRKSGGVSDGDPDAALIEAFLADPIFRLPAGSFVVRATFVGALGDCGGETHSLTVELPLTIVR